MKWEYMVVRRSPTVKSRIRVYRKKLDKNQASYYNKKKEIRKYM